MPTSANPILYQLTADVTRRASYEQFKRGDIGADQYSRILNECNMLDRKAHQQLSTLIPAYRRAGGCYSERKF